MAINTSRLKNKDASENMKLFLYSPRSRMIIISVIVSINRLSLMNYIGNISILTNWEIKIQVVKDRARDNKK